MKIIFYVGTGGPGAWDSRNLERGIGGSEESLCYVSCELIKLGHEVEVYNDRDGFYRDEVGIAWRSQELWHSAERPSCDVFIAWRNWHYAELSTGRVTYLLEQDQPVAPHFAPEAKSLVEQGKFKMILLNEHHKNQHGIAPENAFVCSNGCDITQFEQNVERIPGKCIYLSHPSRGLLQLREYWPKIRAAVPHAELHAFWWQEDQFLPANEAIGIMPMRSLGHMELAREILSSDLFTYPSIFTPEISPVSCIKAQVGGALPVVVMAGGMLGTLIEPYYANYSHGAYADGVIATLTAAWPSGFRERMMKQARIQFNWPFIAMQWASEFETELAK